MMERGPLRLVLATSGLLSPMQKLRFVADTAAGMAYLHRLGCIHRDLKSGELCLTVCVWREQGGGSGVLKSGEL